MRLIKCDVCGKTEPMERWPRTAPDGWILVTRENVGPNTERDCCSADCASAAAKVIGSPDFVPTRGVS